MQLQDRISNESTSFELDYIWSSALNETLLTRINKKFPGYHKLSDRSIPIEIQLERRRLNRILISEISRSIWSDDPNWRRVEQNFDRLKVAYGKMITELDIPSEIAQKWSDRIDKIVLALPGSTPAISDEECSSTTANAYYYTFLNVITVCAGDFNSEDIIQTLAHEMGHALGVDRDAYLFEVNSDFGKKLAAMREKVCEPKSFSCADWEKYKSEFKTSLDSLDSFKPDIPSFQQCLKRRPTTKSLTSDDVDRFASSIVTDHFSELASSDRFLRITKAEIPLRNGKLQKNPNYLNPCSYYLWSLGEEPIHDELTSLMYFTAEYRCSDKDNAARMKSSIEEAKTMTTLLMAKVLKIEGEFSARDRLETEGFSSPPHERFADVLGSYAMSELLREIPEKWDRRNLFLASSSWQCSEPSLASRFPEESSIENQYVFESHSGGDQRKKEFFTTPMRKALGCEKDFEFNECSLPFKKTSD
jgi:hypothetical protein